MTDLHTVNDWASFAGVVTLQATLLLGAAWLATRALRQRTAAGRHAVWTMAVAGAIALPLLGAALPSWQLAVRMPTWAPATDRTADPDAAQAVPAPSAEGPAATAMPLPNAAVNAGSHAAEHVPAGAPSAETRPSRPAPARSAGALALLIWLAGALAVGAATVTALLHTHAVAQRARPLREPGLLSRAARIAAEMGVARPVRLLEGDADAMPITFGLLRPALLLPPTARAWPPARQEAVLRHEMAHVRRCDTLTQLVANVGCALYWFHPLMWMAARRLRVEREHACDDVVLASGTRPSDYAAELLEVARTMRLQRLATRGAIAMAEPSRLHTRIAAVLEDRARSERLSGRLLVPLWIGALAVVTTVSAVAPVPTRALAVRDAVVALPFPNPAPLGPTVAPDGGAPRASPDFVARSAPDAGAAQPTTVAGASPEPTCWEESYGSYRSVYRSADGAQQSSYVMQRALGDLEICLRSDGPMPFDEQGPRLTAMEEGTRLVLASRTPGGRQTIEAVRTSAGLEQTWFVDGAERPFDETARQWRDALLEVAGGYEAISRVRGEVAVLRGQIASIRGEEASRRGEVASIRGREASLRGQIASIRGEEASRRGEVASIRGREMSMRGETASLRGRISSLQGARRATQDEGTRARLDAEIEGVQAEVRRVEAQIAEYNTAGRIQAARQTAPDAADMQARIQEVERQIEAYDAGARIREIERRMAEGDRSGEIAALERRIEAVDADRRVRQLEERLDPQVRRLQEVQSRIR